MPAVTQAHIARHLGLDQKTVSIAFGASGRISETTRRRIVEAAQRMGYAPNRLAAGLRGGRTRSIGVIWAFVDPWAGDAVIGLDVLERLQKRGFATYQAQHSPEVTQLCRQLDDLLIRRVDAIVIQAIPSQLRDPEVARRLEAAPAVVAVTREPLEDFRGDLIVHDRYQAIREVAGHFAASGRRRPCMLLEMEQESNPPKLEAFVAALRDHGIEHERTLVPLDYPQRPESHGQLHLDGFRQAFPGEVDVDAVFCFNDTGALYVSRELQDRGLAIPDDVAVVGFNDTEAGRVWRPELATGDRKHREVALLVDRLLNERLQSPDLPPQRHVVNMSFIWRQSAGGIDPRHAASSVV